MSDTIRFPLHAAIHPSPLEILCQLYGHESLQGEVLARTQAGDEPEQFLVVKIAGLDEPVIVPARKVSLPS
jgi:hypothetical protein